MHSHRKEEMLVRMRQNAEHAAARKSNLMDAIDDCHRRIEQHREIAHVRHIMMMRAARLGHQALEQAWLELQEEAHQMAELEREQMAELRDRYDICEVTAKALHEDYEEEKEKFDRERSPFPIFADQE